ncbi:T7SS effector LXG polymorphic toxin [Staphylococcus epidermidis]|uniref:T7SS effector LXG polymorphic toxin n=1 Tax=Staphylococcus epidermidis TaxID=1282 RepID=UPI00138E52D8|nr:T7SS effector LXG polymorphic toxin [Staphylococcus epidermidis]MDS3947836.1 T7SS effector LXG polymorphic toxin [Staphylococcus epidermidis]
MSIDMYVGKSKGQSSDVESTVKSISSGYDSLQKAIMQFVGASELQGRAYDSGKQFFSSVIAPLTESIKTLGELTEQACNDFVDKYQSEVDSQSLKESELIQDIEELEKQVSQLEAMNASLKHKSSKNISLLSGNDQMISSLEQQKKELEEKLRKLRQFDAKSPIIFKEAESFQKTVQQGISQAKTAWDPGKQAFNIPAGKNMEWAKISQQKALEVRMNKINQKTKDGKKLSKNDIFTIIAYQQQKKNILPKSVQKYMDENANDISKDLTVDGTTTLLEEYGKYLENNPGLTINGKMLKDYGVGIARAGKYGGNVMGVIGFGTGVYSDITQDHKTAGEAVAHNGLTTGAGAGAGLIAGVFLSSTPPGLIIVGVLAAGTIGTIAVNEAYKHNFLGLKTGTDWVGKNVIDPTFNWISDKAKKIYSLEKSKIEFEKNMINTGYKIVKNRGSKIMKDDITPSVAKGIVKTNSKVNDIKHNTESTIKDYKIKVKRTINNTEETVNHVSDTVKDTSNHVRKKVGQSITTVTNSLNPMKAF